MHSLKKFFYRTVILSLFSSLSITLSGCGGGGGGSSEPKFLAVTGTTPIKDAKNVDALLPAIEINFSADIDPISFISEGNALAKLFAENNVKLTDKNGKEVSATGLSLKVLTSGDYMAWVTHPITNANTLAVIASYDFFQDGTAGYGLILRFNDAVPFEITLPASKVISSGLINNSLIKVFNNTLNKEAYGQVILDSLSRKVSFVPLKGNYFDWSTNYTVTVNKNIKGINGKTLEKDFVWSFETKNVPNATIESVFPTGIDASPIQYIYVKPNFKMSGNPAQSAIVVNKITRTSETDPLPVRTQVSVTSTYDMATGEIVVVPASDLEYLAEYEVVVLAGLTGTLGNATVALKSDYTWTFTTALPRVDFYTPFVTNGSDPVVELNSTISIGFNYRPNSTLIPSGIEIRDLTTAAAVPYSVVSNDNGVVVLKPTSLLKFSTHYQVTVKPTLVSAQDPNIHIASNFVFDFSTVHRKVISKSPYSGENFVSENTTITAQFNFDVADGALLNPVNFIVYRRGELSSSWEAVPAQSITYDKFSRTVEFIPQFAFKYNDEVDVIINNTLKGTDGGFLHDKTEWQFTIRNKGLVIVDYHPFGSQVDLTSPIEARMSSELDSSTVKFDTMRIYCNDSLSYLSGTTGVVGDLIYFLPFENLKSNCDYTVSINDSIRGLDGSRPEVSSANHWSFTTDGLRINSIYVTYAYLDYVSISSTIQVNFNHLVSFPLTGDVYLIDGFGSTVSGSLLRSGSTIEFIPSQLLKYGENYTLVVTRFVTGINGETLLAEERSSFVTENVPLNVVDYGPVSDVYTDDIFWVETNYAVGTPGYPDTSASSIYNSSLGYISNTLTTDGGYVLFMSPYTFLDYDRFYDIDFDFNFPNGSTDDFFLSWQVFTSSDLFIGNGVSTILSNSIATTDTSKRKTAYSLVPSTLNNQTADQLKSYDRLHRAAKGVREIRSCRNNRYCVGSFKTKTAAEYKKNVLANKRRANIHVEAAQKSAKQKAAVATARKAKRSAQR